MKLSSQALHGNARWRWALTAIALGCFAATAQAPNDIRIALVIGNSAYPGGAALSNPANDARAMSATLKTLGFTVVELKDGSRAQMGEAVTQVRESLQGKQGIGMLYYAGHGLQLDFRNYMVPVDARLASADDVAAQAIDIGQVIDAFRAAGNRMNILVLDACRDNPFAGQASAKGLAPQDAPTGTFLAYATAPGNVADDGDIQAGNGLYTGFLVKELQKPAARIEDVFKRVRLQVRQHSKGRQIPWESTSLEEDFYFNTGVKVQAPKPDAKARELAFLAEKTQWDLIKGSRSVDDFYAFVAKFPSGGISEIAQARIEALQRATIQTQGERDGKVQVPFDQRYQEGDRYEFVQKDGLTGLVNGRAVIEMRKRGEDEIEGVVQSGNLSGGRTTVAGFILQDGGGTYDPPYAVVPGSAYQVGKKFSGRSIRTDAAGRKSWVDTESRVVAREKLQTAFGLIDTYRIEVTRSFETGGNLKATFWFDPDWGYSVKLITEFRGTGAPDIRIREMVARARRS